MKDFLKASFSLFNRLNKFVNKHKLDMQIQFPRSSKWGCQIYLERNNITSLIVSVYPDSNSLKFNVDRPKRHIVIDRDKVISDNPIDYFGTHISKDFKQYKDLVRHLEQCLLLSQL